MTQMAEPKRKCFGSAVRVLFEKTKKAEIKVKFEDCYFIRLVYDIVNWMCS